MGQGKWHCGDGARAGRKQADRTGGREREQGQAGGRKTGARRDWLESPRSPASHTVPSLLPRVVHDPHSAGARRCIYIFLFFFSLLHIVPWAGAVEDLVRVVIGREVAVAVLLALAVVVLVATGREVAVAALVAGTVVLRVVVVSTQAPLGLFPYGSWREGGKQVEGNTCRPTNHETPLARHCAPTHTFRVPVSLSKELQPFSYSLSSANHHNYTQAVDRATSPDRRPWRDRPAAPPTRNQDGRNLAHIRTRPRAAGLARHSRPLHTPFGAARTVRLSCEDGTSWTVQIQLPNHSIPCAGCLEAFASYAEFQTACRLETGLSYDGLMPTQPKDAADEVIKLWIVGSKIDTTTDGKRTTTVFRLPSGEHQRWRAKDMKSMLRYMQTLDHVSSSPPTSTAAFPARVRVLKKRQRTGQPGTGAGGLHMGQVLGEPDHVSLRLA